MGYAITRNSAAYPLVFLLLDSTDHLSPKTGVTPTVTLSKNGGSFASPAGAIAEVGHGWYRVAGHATDTNTLGPLILHATATGADPADVLYPVVAFESQDIVRLGLTALPNAAAEAAGGLYTRGTGAGQINQPANGQVDTRWVAGNVTVGTLASNTVTAAALAADAVTEIQGAILSDATPFPGARIDATISSRSTYAGGAVASVTAPVTVGTNTDKTGYSLSTAAIQALWDALTSVLTTAGSVGKLLVDMLDATVGSRLPTTSYVPPDTAGIADAVWDEAVDGATTARQSVRLQNAVLGGKLSGGGTSTETMRDLADTKDRVVANVDESGNRTTITRDLS